MPTEFSTCPIIATGAAKTALSNLCARHGGIILHVTGCCCDGRTPLCRPAPNEKSTSHADGI
ncbi:MAG: DUF779 domain-containing protein [Proteobacteria bacterium]|nr:DUF779 domain-containing protein [Pseudomonadota bacterium]